VRAPSGIARTQVRRHTLSTAPGNQWFIDRTRQNPEGAKRADRFGQEWHLDKIANSNWLDTADVRRVSLLDQRPPMRIAVNLAIDCFWPIVLKNPANHHRSGLSEGTARQATG